MKRFYERHGFTKGDSQPPVYTTWLAMRQRCENPRYTHYHRYGGRGIRVCERWKRFGNFLADMGERPKGKTLDRYPNNDGNYEPSNCRWATRKEQGVNKSSTQFIEFDGETLCLADWARRLGIALPSLRDRLRRHPAERALTTPRRRYSMARDKQ